MRLFVDNLINLDFSYLHHQRGLVGETWLASIELEGQLDEQSMVCDFSEVKRLTRKWLESTLDHCLLVPTQAAALTLEKDQQICRLRWRLSNGKEIVHNSPLQALSLIEREEINPDSVGQWCVEQLATVFGPGVSGVKLALAPEDIRAPYYHYSHGLKKHAGLCQRIAHGHRSRIEIWRNGNLSEKDMKAWAARWQDIYIASREDMLSSADQNSFAFAYQAQQGNFELSLPKEYCYLIDSDSTVECIAQHIADTLKAECPEDNFTVKAFEGIAKGAVVET